MPPLWTITPAVFLFIQVLVPGFQSENTLNINGPMDIMLESGLYSLQMHSPCAVFSSAV